MKIMISHNQAPLSGAGHEMSPTTKVSFVQIHVHLAHIKNKNKLKIFIGIAHVTLLQDVSLCVCPLSL